MKRIKSINRRIQNYISRKIDPIAYSKSLGVIIGENCRLIDVEFGSEPYLVKLGNHVSITGSSFITHDGGVWVFREEYPELDIIKPIVVGDNVFIGEGCIIMPGVRIGSNVVIGAGSIVTKSLDSNGVYVGTPARKLKDLEDYKNSIIKMSINTKKLSFASKKKKLLAIFDMEKL